MNWQASTFKNISTGTILCFSFLLPINAKSSIAHDEDSLQKRNSAFSKFNPNASSQSAAANDVHVEVISPSYQSFSASHSGSDDDSPNNENLIVDPPSNCRQNFINCCGSDCCVGASIIIGACVGATVLCMVTLRHALL